MFSVMGEDNEQYAKNLMEESESVASTNVLDSIRKYSTITGDTGMYEDLVPFYPTDVTTNPTLILDAFNSGEEYRKLVEGRCQHAKEQPGSLEDKIRWAMDELNAMWGMEALRLIPGRVSTEIDARSSFDTAACIKRTKQLLSIYEKNGIPRNRILFKIAGTWEGIQAVKQLEEEGIHCNVTLVFSLIQVAASVESNASVVSPFVGRVTDYFKQKEHRDFKPEEDPGVLLVKNIYNYTKTYHPHTQVMAASLRSVGQVTELVGCDLLTIPLKLLGDLVKTTDEGLVRKLSKDKAKSSCERIPLDPKTFRWLMNEDEMASLKLAEGIRKFTVDTIKLEDQVRKLISA